MSGRFQRSLSMLFLPVLLLGCGPLGPPEHRAKSLPESTVVTTVGMPVSWEDLILPGVELEPVPADNAEQATVLRMTRCLPHGDAFRYDLAFYALEPGDYDLGDYLRPVATDQTKPALPPIPVTVVPLLPAGHVPPHELELGPLPRGVGYSTWLVLVGIVWLSGLAWLLLRRRGRTSVELAATTGQMTVTDRLRPLVQSAMTGELAPPERAQLERLLLTYWQEKLGVADQSPARAMAVLRADDEAGALLRQLEDWLHRPDPPQAVDLEAMLAPYAAGGSNR